jgi:hypothetical protein
MTASAALALSAMTLTAGAVPGSAGVGSAGSKLSVLLGVSVVPHSATAWAFGSHGTATSQTWYAIHGSGKHWKSVAVHAPANAGLVSIAAASPKSVWIVGSVFTNGKTLPVVEHSTGGAFRQVKVPQLGQGSLTSVSASAASNVWATGSDTSSGAGFVDRFAGKRWRKQPLGPDNSGFDFTAISTSSPSNTWIAAFNPGNNTPFVFSWNGSIFSLHVTSTKDSTGSFDSIATTSPKNVWIAGSRPETVKGQPTEVAATQRLKGSGFVDVPMPSPGTSAFLASVALVGGRAYTVGQYLTSTQTKPLAEAFASGRWKVEHAAGGGARTLLSSVSASPKVVVTAGLLNATTQQGLGTSLLERLVGSSWHRVAAPS